MFVLRAATHEYWAILFSGCEQTASRRRGRGHDAVGLFMHIAASSDDRDRLTDREPARGVGERPDAVGVPLTYQINPVLT
jgi:hypothetical protein